MEHENKIPPPQSEHAIKAFRAVYNHKIQQRKQQVDEVLKQADTENYNNTKEVTLGRTKDILKYMFIYGCAVPLVVSIFIAPIGNVLIGFMVYFLVVCTIGFCFDEDLLTLKPFKMIREYFIDFRDATKNNSLNLSPKGKVEIKPIVHPIPQNMKKKLSYTLIAMTLLMVIFNPAPQSFFYYIKGKEHYRSTYNPATYRDMNFLIFSIYRFDKGDSDSKDSKDRDYYLGILGNFFSLN